MPLSRKRRSDDADDRTVEPARALATARAGREPRGGAAQGSTGALESDDDGLYDELGYDAEPGERDPSVTERDAGRGSGARPPRTPGGGGSGGGSGDELTPTPAGRHPARPNPAVRLVRFLQGSWRELQRVQWPDRPQVVQATGVVIGFVIIAGAFLAGGDWVAQKIVNFVIG